MFSVVESRLRNGNEIISFRKKNYKVLGTANGYKTFFPEAKKRIELQLKRRGTNYQHASLRGLEIIYVDPFNYIT